MATTPRKVLLCYCIFEDTIIEVQVDSQTDFNEFVDGVCGGLKAHANSVSLHYTTYLNKICFLPLNGLCDLSNPLKFNNESANVHVFWKGIEQINEIRASAVSGGPTYRVYKYSPVHIHSVGDESSCQLHISNKFISVVLLEKLHDSPKYLPLDIIKDFSRNHAISLTYKQAWRGKERAKELLNGSTNDSYKLILWSCKKLVETNLGTVATFTIDDSGRFNQLFVAFHSSLHGFRVGCRPMLFIDATHLKGNYQGQLLAADAYDANNQMFPVAFTADSFESIPDWTWFLENLKIALNDGRKVVIVSDRNTSIRHVVETVFDSEYHAFCSRHLMENLKGCMCRLRLLKAEKEVIEDCVNQLIYTRDTVKFDLYLSKIHNQNLDIYGWIMDSDPPHWENSLFKGRRYDKFTSNLAESFNAWVLEAREQPIMSLVNIIRLKMTELTFRRQCEAKGYKQLVGPNMEYFLKFNISESINLRYTQCSFLLIFCIIQHSHFFTGGRN
uniref:MULE transposase domain-containing protein n=1 Tax=Nelumbo nucifera TaxID=4432 RepID=A0A822XZU5_NELNU|nr:TPA_asm: hypothetical protein HUJ06_026023 [Nelumbo nucifera]